MGKVGNLTRLVDVVEPDESARGGDGRSLRMVLVGMVVLAVALVAVAISGAAPGTDASVKTFDQCANGQPPSTATSCPNNWIFGILNANNSHYAEDDVTPQRVILILPKGGPLTGRTVKIDYQTRKGGVHAYDSLATWNHTQTTADRCADLNNPEDCVAGSASTFPIPADPTVVADNNGAGSATSGHQLGGQVMTMYGGTITGISVPTHDDPSGSGDEDAHVIVTYSVPDLSSAGRVMLLFGGHIAASTGPRGWGVGVGAGSISGGPYHISICEADGASVGCRDNQIMSGAILAPASLLIEKVAVGGDATFNYTSTGGLSPASFPIATSGGTGSQSFANITPGTYTVTESAPPVGWDFTSLDCVDEDGNSSDTGMTSNIVLAAGETATCTYTNTLRGSIVVDKVTAPSGDPQSFPFTLTGGPDAVNQGFSLTDSAAPHNSGLVKPGTYAAAETSVPAGWDLTSSTCSDGSSPGSISLEAGETVTCTFTNTRRGRIIVEKQTVPNGDPTLFSFTPNYGSSFQLSDGQQNSSGLIVPGTYSVSETVPAGWNLTSATCSDGSSPSSIVLGPNETVTCVFTNTKAGEIIVQKQTDPDGSPQSFAFTASYDADGFSLTDGQSNNSGPLAPGTYSVAETVPDGWDLESAVCDDGSAPGSIALASDETVTCVFSNTLRRGRIIVQKQTNPDGDPQVFAFTASYDANGFSLSDGQSNNSGALLPGTYSVSETVPVGWNLASAVCSDQSDPSAIALGPGETVTCVFTNAKDAMIIVEKQTNPNGDPQVFAFAASYDANGFTLSDGQSNNSGVLDPGTYSVSETVPAGWDLGSAVCDDGSAPASIGLAAGETVTCVFTNVKDAFIVVEKQTNPDGDPQVFSFSASYDANGFTLSDGQSNNSGDLNPGVHSVSENVPAGWDLASAVCSDSSDPSAIGLQAGETVTCVFTNVRDANIIVEKQTDPNGSPQVFDFDASYDASGFSLSDGQSNNSGDLDPGTYSVSEIVPAGWDLTSAVCSDGSPRNAIALAAGEKVTCVFTNTLRRGRIIVEKQTDPGGDPQVFDFTASYDANGFSLFDGQQSESGELLPGTYSVSETVPAGWDLESAVCSDQSSAGAIELDPGETVTCVFTNVKDANIIVEKQTDPNGSPQVFSFNASYDANGFSLSDGQSNSSGDLDPGTYSVSENVPQGWELTSNVCSDGSDPSSIDLQAGETVTCVFTNTQAGRIIVEKQTNPNGSPQVFDFEASYDEGGFSLSDGQQNNSGSLEPGTYSVAENVPAGWELTSAVCSDESDPSSIELGAGEVVTCVFTNTELATIIVEKQTNPNGAAGSFSFSGDAAGSIGDGGQIVVSDLAAGTYTSTEAAADGWTLTAITCDDGNSSGSVGTRMATFRLEAGEVVKCSFFNSLNQNLGQGAIDVQKSANPTRILEPGGPVTFSVTITNVSTVDVAITNVVDDKFGDLDDDGGNGCFDVPVNLAPGEKVNCTFERTITGAGGTSHVNTVTASGQDENGKPVSDSDDARVDIDPRLIDLVIVKEASSPTPLNGTVNYTMTVTNRGPHTATNVQVADPAPVGITYLTANPSQGSCAVSPSLVTCSLGTIAPGQTVTIAISARATAVGSHTNTATVTGSGGRETNPADNVDSAVTVVPAPLRPPTVKPTPKPAAVCITLTVSPQMIKADGKPDKVSVRVSAGQKRLKGVKVVVSGAGVRKSGTSNGKGLALLRINPRKAGIITITASEPNQKVCGPKRIGVVGVFLPPLTG